MIHCAGGVGRTGFVAAAIILKHPELYKAIKAYTFPSFFKMEECKKQLDHELIEMLSKDALKGITNVSSIHADVVKTIC
jgi:protein tyrosine phosphatase